MLRYLAFTLLLVAAPPLCHARLVAHGNPHAVAETNPTFTHVPYNPLMALYALNLCKASYCVPDTVAHSTSTNTTTDMLQTTEERSTFVAEVEGLIRQGLAHEQQLSFELYDIYINASWGTLAYAGVDHLNQRIIAAFRGSHNLNNWLSDLTFWSEHYPCPVNETNSSSSSSSSSSSEHDGDDKHTWTSNTGFSAPQGEVNPSDLDEAMRQHYRLMTEPGECRVHQGFHRAYHSLSSNITSDLLQLHHQFPKYAFLVTGHSLGGAMAYICALDLVTQPAYRSSESTFTAPFEVYTFGEPRSSNQALNEFAATQLELHPNGNRKHFRLTHGRDPVPHLPPMSWGYLHQPQELWYYRNGTEDDNPFVFAFCNGDAASEDPMCSNSVWSTTISDHLWYMGTCTRCLCTKEERDSFAAFEIGLAWQRMIEEENAQERTKAEMMRATRWARRE